MIFYFAIQFVWVHFGVNGGAVTYNLEMYGYNGRECVTQNDVSIDPFSAEANFRCDDERGWRGIDV